MPNYPPCPHCGFCGEAHIHRHKKTTEPLRVCSLDGDTWLMCEQYRCDLCGEEQDKLNESLDVHLAGESSEEQRKLAVAQSALFAAADSGYDEKALLAQLKPASRQGDTLQEFHAAAAKYSKEYHPRFFMTYHEYRGHWRGVQSVPRRAVGGKGCRYSVSILSLFAQTRPRQGHAPPARKRGAEHRGQQRGARAGRGGDALVCEGA